MHYLLYMLSSSQSLTQVLTYVKHRFYSSNPNASQNVQRIALLCGHRPIVDDATMPTSIRSHNRPVANWWSPQGSFLDRLE
jgi:hypothetical protein